jgi:hypothetical protein
VLDCALGRFPTLQEVDAECGVRGIERQVADKAKAMVDALLGVVTRLESDPASLLGLRDLLKQKRMVACFDAQNVAHVMRA